MAAQDNLKVYAIAGRTASGAATAVDDVDQEELRLPVGALLTPGYLPNLLTQAANLNSFKVRQNTGSDMNLKVGSGTSKVDGYVLLGGVAGQGAYILRLDATTKTVSVPAADATNPARYGVYAFIDDTAYSGDASRAYANVTCIRGTPAGSPATPGPLAAWSAYALLWEFQLAANATAVTNTILDAGIDRRQPSRSTLPLAATRYQRSSNQPVPTATLTTIDWDTAVANPFAWTESAGTLTVPTGGDGLYLISVRMSGSSPLTTITVTAAGQAYQIVQDNNSALKWAGSFVAPLAAADTVLVKVQHSSGTTDNFAGFIDIIRIG